MIYSNPQYYTLSTSNEEQQLDSSSSSATAELSVGLLFNIRSKLSSNDDTIYITGFEFYTHITGNVFYQLYSMDGEYYTEPDGASGGQGINDDWEKLDTKYLVSGGLAEGYGMCTRESYDEYVADGGGGLISSPVSMSTLTRQTATGGGEMVNVCPLAIVPFDNPPFSLTETLPTNYPWILRGMNSTRSFYITLASKDLYVSPSTSTSSSDPTSFDTVISASTNDLDIYEGVATRTYPLDQNNSDYYYELPQGFIGKVHYFVGNGGSLSLLATPDGGTPQVSPTLTPTVAPQTILPTAKPTRRCRPGRPCLNPPSPPTPTTSPIVSGPIPMTIELIVYLENAPGRTMSEREEEEYIEIMTAFLQENNELRKNGVSTESLDIFYHNVLDEDMINSRGKGVNKVGAYYDTALLLPGSNASESFIYHYNTKSTFIPKVYPTVYVMTKIDVITMGLPYDVTTFFIWDELRTNEMLLMETFNANSLFVSYFRDLTNITFEMMEGLSEPPTKAPIKSLPPTALSEVDDEEAQIQRRNIYTFVGVFLGILWFILTLFSIRKILKYRRKAKQSAQAKEVRKQSLSARSRSSRRGNLSKTVSSRFRRFSIWGSHPHHHHQSRPSEPSSGPRRSSISDWDEEFRRKSAESQALSSPEEYMEGMEVLDAHVDLAQPPTETDTAQRVYYDNGSPGGSENSSSPGTNGDSGTGHTGDMSSTVFSESVLGNESVFGVSFA